MAMANFLFCGFLLALIFKVQASHSADRITSLPGFDGDVASDHSGYNPVLTSGKPESGKVEDSATNKSALLSVLTSGKPESQGILSKVEDSATNKSAFSFEKSDLRKNQSKDENSIVYSDMKMKMSQNKEVEDSIEELSDLSFKLHDIADQIAKVQLLPKIRKLSVTPTPIIGHVYASLAAIIILLIPIFLVIFMLVQIRPIFSLDKILLFINIYLITSVAILLLMNLILGIEPLHYLQNSVPSAFTFLQLLHGTVYFVDLLLYGFNLLRVCSVNGIGARVGVNEIGARVGALIEWSIILCIGLHYYVAVSHRATPNIGLMAYLLYLLGLAWLLLVICLKLKTGKKEYTGRDTMV